MTVTFADIRDAHRRIEQHIHRTPVLTSRSLDELFDAGLYFKCENFQKTGSFKCRGATNAVLSLSHDEVSLGVATHSSGNHGAALARAATSRGVPSWIVMPEGANPSKCEAVRAYGGEIVFCEPTMAGREAQVEVLLEATGATFIHPYNNPLVIAGQGTAAIELLDETPFLDMLLAPIGGGGLLSGTGLAVQALSRDTRVVGAEPEQANDAALSFRSGRIETVTPNTIADGLRATIGDLTLPIIREHVSDIVTVSEDAIVEAMRLVWQRMKIIIEPAAAVPVAAILEQRIDVAGQRVGIIISGGNADLDALPW